MCYQVKIQYLHLQITSTFFYPEEISRWSMCPTQLKCSICISDSIPTTFFYLERFLKKTQTINAPHKVKKKVINLHSKEKWFYNMFVSWLSVFADVKINMQRIWSRGKATMNKDEGAYTLDSVYDQIITKRQPKTLATSSSQSGVVNF